MSSSKTEILRASRDKERRKKQVRVFVGVLSLVSIVVGFFLILNLSFLRVNRIIVNGQTSADKTEIKQAIEKQLAGDYLFFVPRNSIFFISKGTLTKFLYKQYAGLKEVDISWPDLNTLSVVVADESLKILWCVDLKTGSNCYYLTSGGVAYQLAPNFSNHLFTEIHTKQPLSRLGDRVIEPLALNRTGAILDFLRQQLNLWPNPKLKFTYAHSYAHGDFVAYLGHQEDPHWRGKIIFNTKQDAETVITALNSALKNEDFLADWQSNNGRLDYLDLRFVGKVFYRFK